MIQIDKSDSIVDILTKISDSDKQEIVLQFPFGHPVLHNYLSLKIIQTKLRKKKLLILTNDKTSKKIGKLLGIKYGKNKHELKDFFDSESQNIIKENYSFIEYSIYEIKKFFGTLKGGIQSNKKINSINYSRNKHRFLHKNIFMFLISISIIIIGLLVYIFYFAINKTYIEITPEISVKTKSRNYTYVEAIPSLIENEVLKNNEIPLNKISEKILIKNTFSSSGIKQKNNNIAKGEVTVYNLFPNEVSLLKNTTFQTKDGIQFENLNEIKIPPATIDKSGKLTPGSVTQILNSKIKLLNGSYSGEESNIEKDILLTIPKLGEDKSKIFAKTLTNFEGGTNDFIKVIKQEDIDNAEIAMKDILEQASIKKIKSLINEENNNNNIQLDILPVDNIYKFSNYNVVIPEHIKPGDQRENFEISGSVNVIAYSYNTEILRSKLKQIINDGSILGSEKIDSINPKSLRVSHIISRNDLVLGNGEYKYLQELSTPLRIKATTEIEYYISKNFENQDNYFSHKLKSSITGTNIVDAEDYLVNLPQINNVNIRVQPFFLKTISKIPDNIIIKVLD
ncbi:hypothetical protein LR004_00205 [Candidatus Gracilibacteria bacterium]|nr:hypothetical protein [Candidatus Gracilibacteria bacterium]